jgi:hypothetical protein
MCTVLLPPGVNPIAVNKYIDININTKLTGKQALTVRYTKSMVPIFERQAIIVSLLGLQLIL